MKNKWTIIHDITVVYAYFLDLGKDDESNFSLSLNKMEDELIKWEFTIENEMFGLKRRNPLDYSVLYALRSFEFLKSPLDRINQSMQNLVNYYNAGVLNGKIMNTLFNSINNCIGDEICEGQIHQMEYYTNMWMPHFPDLKALNTIMRFKLSVINPEYLIENMDTIRDDMLNLLPKIAKKKKNS